MQLPTYWARATFKTTTENDRVVVRHALGWSSTSQAEAQALAGERAKRAADRGTNGQATAYEYGEVPPRETQVDTVIADGQVAGIITRNRYGCLVLNAARVLFADIDFAQRPGIAQQSLGGLIAGLFKKKTPPATAESAALEKVEAWHAAHPSTSFRAYRTFAGLRLLFTDRLYDPKSPAVRDMLRSLDSDLLYYTLTQRQGCFRARLSPKPWRCGVGAMPYKSFVDNPTEPKRIGDWLDRYQPRAEAYDT